MVFDCGSRDSISRDARLFALNSLYAEHGAGSGVYLLHKYRPKPSGMVVMSEWRSSETVEGLAEKLLAFDLRVREYDSQKDKSFPFIKVGAERKILEIGSQYDCLSFDPPAVWLTDYAAQRHAELWPSFSKKEREGLLAILLPKAKRA